MSGNSAVEIRCCPICAGYRRRAREMREALVRAGLTAGIVRGRWGEFTVLLDGRVIAKRRWLRAPSVPAVVEAALSARS